MELLKNKAQTIYSPGFTPTDQIEVCLTITRTINGKQAFRYKSQRESLNQIWFSFETPEGDYDTAVQKYVVDSKGNCHILKTVHFIEETRKRYTDPKATLRAAPIYKDPSSKTTTNKLTFVVPRNMTD